MEVNESEIQFHIREDCVIEKKIDQSSPRPMDEYIGKSYPRVDGYEKVTGQAKFVDDMNLGRVLHARVVRSTQAHARIIRLDIQNVRQLPGVRAVITGDHCPKRIGHALADQYPLARDKVRYWGEPVAVIVADSLNIADAATELVNIEYDPLPVVLHPRQAVHPDAPLIHEELPNYYHDPLIHSIEGTNIAHHYRLIRGNVEKAYSEAHLIVENEYWVPWIAHVQIEPHGCVAQWDGEMLSIWTSSQSPFFVRDIIAHMLDISPSRVRVHVPYVGGGFGGKSDVTIEPLLAIVAHAIPGTPIQLTLTREEMFFGTLVGRGVWGKVKHAVDTQGKLLAEEAELYYGSGGYADYSVWISQGGGHNSTGPYYIPNLNLNSYCVYTNTPPTGAYRGYGHPEVHWMVERQMDQIAHQLGIDPVEFRQKNLLGPGMVNSLGQVMKDYFGQPNLCLKTVQDTLGKDRVPTQAGRVRGQGIACFMKSPVMRSNAQSGAILRFNEDGSVTLFTGAIEIGQGVSTILTQIAAQTLAMPPEMVHCSTEVDTQYSPYEWQTVASHTTWAVGNAVHLAALDALNQIKASAAIIFGIPEIELETDNARVFPRGQEKLAISYAQIGVGYRRSDGTAVNPPVVGRGSFVPLGLTHPDPNTGQGNLAASWTFGCQGVDLEVDPESGQISVLRLISALDAGRIINPETARGQVEGAMVMALGASLLEKLHFDPSGKILNDNLVDYRIPLSVDTPAMEVYFLETLDASGPYGARGIGEHGIVAIPPAIANALSQALEVDFHEIPITPEMVLEAFASQKKNSGTPTPYADAGQSGNTHD